MFDPAPRRRAVFLDRDGTVIEETHLVTRPEDMTLERRAAEAIIRMKELGFGVFIVTNQPQVARGLCTEEDIQTIHESLMRELGKRGARVDQIYFCPHHPEKRDDIPDWAKPYRIDCECRKPGLGMLLQAANEHSISLEHSYVIGDRTVDLQTALNAGCFGILVETGEAGRDGKYPAQPAKICENLSEAAEFIEKRTFYKIAAAILAGGMGSRLSRVAQGHAKAMVRLQGKPAIEHHIERLLKLGIETIVVCTGHLSEQIETYLLEHPAYGRYVKISKENEPMGTGGALKHAERHFDPFEHVLVLNADMWVDFDLKELVACHLSHGADYTLTVRESDHPFDSDIVLADGGRVVKYLGRGQSEHKTANCGVSIFRKEMLKDFPAGKSSFETECVFPWIDQGRVYAYELKNGVVYDFGTPDRLETLKKRLGETV